MTWLSKLTLDIDCRLVLRDLGNAYEMHRSILRAFPDQSDGGPGRVLFRVEPIRPGDDMPRPVVLVQSEKEPAWNQLSPNYLLEKPDWKEMSCVHFPVGTQLRFRLRANPTKRLRADSRNREGQPIEAKWIGKRVGLFQEEEQRAWLIRKGGDGGFEVARDLLIVPDSQGRSRRTGKSVTHAAVRFDGMLRVTDADKFGESLSHGIGAAKGFGFGLLSVAPP